MAGRDQLVVPAFLGFVYQANIPPFPPIGAYPLITTTVSEPD